MAKRKPKIDTIGWKNRYPNRGVDARKAYEAIEVIRSSNGGELSANDVLASASKKNSVLHELFTWDNTLAAHQHRLTQARSMMRAIEVTYVKATPSQSRAYEISFKAEAGDGSESTQYARAIDIYTDADARGRLVSDALRVATAWRNRHSMLDELSPIFDAIDQANELAESQLTELTQ